jgi:hypothetical protein
MVQYTHRPAYAAEPSNETTNWNLQIEQPNPSNASVLVFRYFLKCFAYECVAVGVVVVVV